jgi:predicted DCC family thiol-disulfide oxidoreductase YuxK
MVNKPIIAYDNACRFCTSAKVDVEKIDRKKKLNWVGIKNFDNKKYNLNKKELLNEMHLIDGKNIYKGYYAWKQIAKRIPLMYPLYLISLIPGVDFIGKLIYRWVSKHRYNL